MRDPRRSVKSPVDSVGPHVVRSRPVREALFGLDESDLADDGPAVGEDAADVRPALDFAIQSGLRGSR